MALVARSMATAGGLGNVTTGAGITKMQLFVVDPHTIYRRGLVACLEMLPEIDVGGRRELAGAGVGEPGAAAPPTSC